MSHFNSAGQLQGDWPINESDAPDAIGVTEALNAPPEIIGTVLDPDGVPVFFTDGPYVASDGTLQEPIPVKPRAVPPPLIPGPLDVIQHAPNGFTNFSESFDLAKPDAIVGLSCRYTGDPIIAMSHGGEPLSIIRQDRNNGVLSLLALGTGLTMESALFTVSATGGTLEEGALRINEVDSGTVGWSGGVISNGIQSGRLTADGASGGLMKLAYGHMGKSYSDYGKFWATPTAPERVFWGRTISGDPLPYDFGPDDPNWTMNSTWEVNDEGQIYSDRPGISGGAYFVSYYTIPEPLDRVAWKLDVVIADELSAIKVGGKYAGNGYPSETIFGPYDGVLYAITYGTEPMVRLEVGLRGTVLVRSIQAMDNGEVFNFAFGSLADATDGKQYMAQYGETFSALSGIEILTP